MPIIFFWLIILWALYFLFSVLWIWSSGYPEKRGSTPFPKLNWDAWTHLVLYYDIFGYLWMNAILVGSAQFILAATAATWYFTHTSDTGGKSRLRNGFKWLAIYHLGSIVFGSFIIAVCQMIRVMFEWYRRLLTGTMNPTLLVILKITSYCIACLN